METKDLDEVSTLGRSKWDSFDSTYRGVETTFKILSVVKGQPPGDWVVLHHYRLETEDGYMPQLVWFASGDTNQYLLYLAKDGPGRYSAAGQKLRD